MRSTGRRRQARTKRLPLAQAAASVWIPACRSAVCTVVVAARFCPSGSAPGEDSRFGPSRVAPANGAAWAPACAEETDAEGRDSCDESLRGSLNVLLQTLSVASGARPAKLYALAAPGVRFRRGDEARTALVGADRVPLHVCTVPVVNPVRYPLSAGAGYNLKGEITEVTGLRRFEVKQIPSRSTRSSGIERYGMTRHS